MIIEREIKEKSNEIIPKLKQRRLGAITLQLRRNKKKTEYRF